MKIIATECPEEKNNNFFGKNVCKFQENAYLCIRNSDVNKAELSCK